MKNEDREVHYEGWLIKSPPTKRIWRARWRRRWFTLKQGEIPEQFCLEYYTDRNCRKLKGVIDLDQCEQVDCGLRLENRKQKFQFMFDIKTPKRTYYLAADTEADMRDWVNCICQVCHLHDTKQSNELQDENRPQNTATTALTNSINTTTTSISHNSTSGLASGQSFNNDLLRLRAISGGSVVVEQQPQSSNATSKVTATTASACKNNDCAGAGAAYVNTEYTNRETLLCDMRFDRQQLAPTSNAATASASAAVAQTPPSPGAAALYLNSPVFQAYAQSESLRLAVNANGVVRKIPENLVLNNTPLPDAPHHSVQPSPALSTASGPYIPISECFSGSPKFMPDGNNPTTPLNNLDPKFYDTPRSHNNIGLNLTNDQSYSPKITNCSLPQPTQPMPSAKNRCHRSDSDSESVFTDDDEWTHPMPLRENVDRSTRPSESSVENESFVLTYSQRFSKLPEDGAPTTTAGAAVVIATKEPQQKHASPTTPAADPLEKLAKVLKNKNNLILDFKQSEKITRDLPQLSDTENTSPAIGPRDATSVVEESYDIPRSHQLPYYNMSQLFEKVVVASPDSNPIATSTPNLMAGALAESAGVAGGPGSPAASVHVRTLPRPHCYTNAAPSKVEGNVFRYDFVEQGDLPPVNRKLKPRVNCEDKPPDEVAAKPPATAAGSGSPRQVVEGIANKLMPLNSSNIQSPGPMVNSPFRPPSVDRKLKPNAYKSGNAATMATSSRRSTGAPLSMVLSNDNSIGMNEGGGYLMETRTLPRQMRPNYAAGGAGIGGYSQNTTTTGGGMIIQHQRTASAAAAMQIPMPQMPMMQLSHKNEHKLQYFDLDVANPPAINRQSMSVGNLNASGGGVGIYGNTAGRLGLSADPSARGGVKSSVVYNSVDFVKTEAFKRIREERKKESESVNINK